MIPGLEEAEFVRFGQMHRNTYIHAPSLLDPTMTFRGAHGEGTLFFAGQITGTEGYIGSTSSGYVAGLNAARMLLGQEPLVFPPTTMIGALVPVCDQRPGREGGFSADEGQLWFASRA